MIVALNARALASRFEGRLFSEEGRLYFILDVDTDSGFARVSCRGEDGQQVIQIPISEIGLRLSTGSNLLLDSLSNTASSNRIIQRTDGWYFTTREGPKGPYPSETAANLALSKHILSRQAVTSAD
jgi:hypothetical protein